MAALQRQDVQCLGWKNVRNSAPRYLSSRYKGIDHLFFAGVVESDSELVAFHARHPAVAEFLMKHAVTARVLRRGGIARLHGVSLTFDHRRPRARATRCCAIGLRPFPAR